MAGLRGTFLYHSDDGSTPSVSLDASNALAGGFVPTPTPPNKPLNMKMRYVLVRHPTSGRERKVYCALPTNAHYIGAGGETLAIEDFSVSPSTVTDYIVTARVGERRYAR
jgi:hypothetical protein